jgi:hypothetical protein
LCPPLHIFKTLDYLNKPFYPMSKTNNNTMPTFKTQNEINRLEDKFQKEVDDLRSYVINENKEREIEYTDFSNAIKNIDTYATFLTFLVALCFISICTIGVLILK